MSVARQESGGKMTTKGSKPGEFASGAHYHRNYFSTDGMRTGSRSSRFAIVVLQQPAEADFAADGGERHGVRSSVVLRR